MRGATEDHPLIRWALVGITIAFVVLFLFLQRYIISGLTAGAVKG